MGGGEVGPTAGGVEAREGADGADDGGGGDGDFVHFFDELFEGDDDILAALDVESEGASVTVDGVVIADIKGVDDPLGAAPVEIGFLDFFNPATVTDLAFAAVAFEIGVGGDAGFEEAAGIGEFFGGAFSRNGTRLGV